MQAITDFHHFLCRRLVGKAKVSLEQLVASKDKKTHVDVNLTDGYGNPTEVTS